MEKVSDFGGKNFSPPESVIFITSRRIVGSSTMRVCVNGAVQACYTVVLALDTYITKYSSFVHFYTSKLIRFQESTVRLAADLFVQPICGEAWFFNIV
jgi:hypothetical protein